MSATEPLSRVLRRLHEEATPLRPPQRSDEVEHVCFRMDHDDEWIEAVQRALPALADLVEETEAEYAGHREGCTCTMHGLLAALRERLGAKP
jgi:hypothetical protein